MPERRAKTTAGTTAGSFAPNPQTPSSAAFPIDADDDARLIRKFNNDDGVELVESWAEEDIVRIGSGTTPWHVSYVASDGSLSLRSQKGRTREIFPGDPDFARLSRHDKAEAERVITQRRGKHLYALKELKDQTAWDEIGLLTDDQREDYWAHFDFVGDNNDLHPATHNHFTTMKKVLGWDRYQRIGDAWSPGSEAASEVRAGDVVCDPHDPDSFEVSDVQTQPDGSVALYDIDGDWRMTVPRDYELEVVPSRERLAQQLERDGFLQADDESDYIKARLAADRIRNGGSR